MPSAPSYTKAFLKPLIAAVIMGGAAWASYGAAARVLGGMSAFQKMDAATGAASLSFLGNAVSTAAAIGVGVIVYFALVLMLRVISKEDLELMPKGDKIARLLRIK